MNALDVARNIDEIVAGLLVFLYNIAGSFGRTAVRPVRGALRVAATGVRSVNARSALLVALGFVFLVPGPRWGADYLEGGTLSSESLRVLFLLILTFIGVDLICAAIGHWAEARPRRRVRAAAMIRMAVATGILAFGLQQAFDRGFVIWVYGDLPPSRHAAAIRAVREIGSLLWIPTFWPVIRVAAVVMRKRLPARRPLRQIVFAAGFLGVFAGAALILACWIALWSRIATDMFPEERRKFAFEGMNCAATGAGRFRFAVAVRNGTGAPVVIADADLDAKLARAPGQPRTALTNAPVDGGVVVVPGGETRPVSFDAVAPPGFEAGGDERCVLAATIDGERVLAGASPINRTAVAAPSPGGSAAGGEER